MQEDKIKKRQIHQIINKGKQKVGIFLTLFIRKNGLTFSRLVVKVPRKLCGAVKRNRWRRLIKETFRLNREKIPKGIDVVAIPTLPPGKIKRNVVEYEFMNLILQDI
jgi:ribonuclease P protein component